MPCSFVVHAVTQFFERVLNLKVHCAQNIIMAPAGKDTDGEDSFRVGAFIDFEDFCYTPLINELAIALAYTLMRAIGCGTAALLDMVTNVLKGYCSNLLLRDDELEGMCASACLSSCAAACGY